MSGTYPRVPTAPSSESSAPVADGTVEEGPVLLTLSSGPSARRSL